MSDVPIPPPSPADKARIEAIVAQCIEALERGEKDPATRLCGGDTVLLPLVQRRLAHLAARGLIPDTEMMPASIGPYRVLKELGSGGMGHVYLADQTSPVRRQVALKVIKLGMDTREVVARFQAERQALALMNHPNIAAVFDAGITGEGRPYFVMEYVPGHQLTAFCDERKLPTEARVRLLATICRAVQHAHDRGFIHRDLKPSNILVVEHEGEFVPKVIDFGVAKATAAAGEAAATQAPSLRTRADQVLGTPEYMSPEQMMSGGLDVDTRTDVYSLGVTLYEMLCGDLPFDSKRLRSVGRNELERILRDEPPTQPSKRVLRADDDVVAARGGERSTVQREVAGELDWITLKALAKVREQRYPSALALAEDLERWLRHEPVLAAPPGRTYRLRKFVRRHRVAVAAAAAVLVSLVAGLAISLRATADARDAEQRSQTAAEDARDAQRASETAATEAREAREREAIALADTRAFFGLARDAINGLVDAADEQLADVPQADAVRRRMLATALEYYAAMQRREPRDVDLQIDRLIASRRVAQLQRQLGEPAKSLATLQQCVADAAALRAANPDNGALLAASVNIAHAHATTLTALGRRAEAKQALHKALALLAEARRLPTGSMPDVDAQEARLLANLAIESDDDPAAAVGLYEQAFAKLDGATASPNHTRDRARMTVDYAVALTRANRLGDAAQALQDAAARLRTVTSDRSVDARSEDATLHSHLADVLRRLNRSAEARAAQQHAIDVYDALAVEHPDIADYADQVAGGWHALGQIDEDEARLDDALVHLRKAVDARTSLMARFPQHVRIAMRTARSLLTMANIQLQQWQHHGGDAEAPRQTLHRATEIVDALHRAHPDDLEVLVTYGAVHTAAGSLQAVTGHHEQALAEHLDLHDELVAKVAAFPNHAELRYQLAVTGSNLFQAYYLLRRPDDALAAGEEGLQHCERGLELDARHLPLRDLLPSLVGRTAAAHFALDDVPAGVAMLQKMCDHPTWGRDANEQGCLLLAEQLQHLPAAQRSGEWHERLVTTLRRLLTARGSLADALKRPAQKSGISHVGSRLRDLDLRMALGNLLGELQRFDEQATLLAEAQQLAATLPELGDNRLRNLFAQRMENSLQARDAARVEAIAGELLAAIGEHGGCNYMLAVLLTKAALLAAAPGDRERMAGKAVACLGRALADGEVAAAAAQHPNFASLRGRADYELLTR